MKLVNLLRTLRGRLLNALEGDNKDELSALMMTFAMLKEAAYSEQDTNLATLLEDMEYSAQHGVMGVKSKALASIPPLEILDKACA
jgi:hypothetical protein